MAEALFWQKAAQLPDADAWRVESAGTWALAGALPASRAREVLRARGVELGDRRARSVDRDLLRAFDLILTMERGHKEALRAEFPEIGERVYILSEMVGLGHDIPDPMGGTLIDFQDTARELDQYLTRGFDRITQLARSHAKRAPQT
jgi:protein-tyrosine-phosphatase